MRTLLNTFIAFLVVLLFTGCEEAIINNSLVVRRAVSDSSISINEAQTIYTNFSQKKALSRTSNQAKNRFNKKLQWQFAHREKFANGTEVILIPLDPNVNNYIHSVVSFNKKTPINPDGFAEVFTNRKVVVYRCKGKDQVEFMSIVGEQSYKKQVGFFDEDKNFTGAILFHDDENNFLRGFYYEKGKIIATLQENGSNKNARLASCSIYAQNIYIDFYYTVRVGGINYGPYNNFTDTRTSYTTNYPPQNPGYQPINYTGSDNNWFNNPANSIYNNYAVYGPPNVIQNIKFYLKCFSSTGSNYRIFMSVDQPSAGSEAAYNPSALDKHKVGHAYLTFQQTLSNGQVIRRTVGFYPDGGGTPANPSGAPAYNDDSQYSGGWDVQVQFSVTGTEFMQVISVVEQYGSQNYNLMNRNCGNMCADALQQAGISISTNWMNQFWGSSSPGTGAPITFTSYGPSIGALGQQLYNVQSTKVISRSHSGGSPSSNAGSCN